MKKFIIVFTVLLTGLGYAQDFTTIASCLTRGKTGMDLIKTKRGKVYLREFNNGDIFEKKSLKEGEDFTITSFGSKEELLNAIKSHELIRHSLKNYNGSYDNVRKILITGSTYQIWGTLLDAHDNHVYGAILAQSHVLECTVENKKAGN